MNSHSRSLRAASVSSLLVIVVASCGDITPTGIAPESAVQARARLGLAPPDRTLRDEFHELALRAPGFAGIWVGDRGELMISTTTPLSPHMRFVVFAWLRQHGRPELAAAVATEHVAKHDFAEAVGYLEKAKVAAVRIPGVNSFGIDEKDGRVIVGVDNADTQNVVRSLLKKTTGLPSDGWIVQIFAPAVDVIGLQDLHESMTAGIQISRGDEACSVGLVGWRMDPNAPGSPDYSYRIITTASHCTSSQTAVNHDIFGQPTILRQVATEVDEAAVYYQGGSTCGAYIRSADMLTSLSCMWTIRLHLITVLQRSPSPLRTRRILLSTGGSHTPEVASTMRS